MMKIRQILKKTGMSIFLLLLAVAGLRAQTPAYLCELRNDNQVDARTFEFDVYLLRTGSTPFELANIQFGIVINAGVRNGGTISVSLVAASSGLNAAQTPTPLKLTFDATKNCILMSPMANPGTGLGTIISDVGPGTRVGKFRLTNTVNFGAVQPNLTWSWSITPGYPTKVSAYVSNLATDITVQASHTISNLTNLMLNPTITAYTVTGGGSYCQGAGGLPIGLTNSQLGVTYTLYKDAIAQTPTVAGTGTAITFGNQFAGTYTVEGTNIGGTTSMTENAVITENPMPTTPTCTLIQPTCTVPTGTITVTAPTGTGMTYSIDGTTYINTSGIFEMLPANTYSVTAKSLDGCISMGTTEIITNILSGPVHNLNTLKNYCTIQAAIDDASTVNGHTITVDAGTYAENVIVNKSVELRGPNFNISPNGGVREAEAIVVPGSDLPSSGEIFHVAADNVSILGFTVDGDNPSLSTNGYGFDGADMHAVEGITIYEENIDGLTVKNNIIQNLSFFGITLYPYCSTCPVPGYTNNPTSGHLIEANLFRNLGTYNTGTWVDKFGGGVLLYNF
ncbi:MAG: hypothetical protein Q8N05_09725 [Bacteroidota bacterium]|nr:hypothetical protein [Bacteroidota bacterium]